MLKRLFDILVSASAISLLIPLWILISLLICVDSKGAPFFTHTRIGKNAVPFNMIKFRSMVSNAQDIGSWQTAENDPRITRVGRILRRTSLDELPQLLNVLIGQMSLVGPRPETPHQEGDYNAEDWQQRHKVKPGITGLAQIMGRSNISAEKRLAYDLLYADKVGLLFDLNILIRTVGVVLSQKNSN